LAGDARKPLRRQETLATNDQQSLDRLAQTGCVPTSLTHTVGCPQPASGNERRKEESRYAPKVPSPAPTQ